MPVDDAYTVALLHFNGADASTTFTDESGKTWTRAGDAQIDTAQSKFGGASGLFDGTGDYVTGTDSADFDFAGDFSIDFWVRINATGAIAALYDARPALTNGLYINLYKDAADQINLYVDSADRINGTTALTTGAWYHVALTRSGTSTKLFLNGTQEGSTYTDSNSYINGASRPALGTSGYDTSATNFNGWMDELRVSKGVARWAANFTPPGSEYPLIGGFFAFF